MPSDRLTARVPTTPQVHDELKTRVDEAGLDTYDDYLRVVLGLPNTIGETADTREITRSNKAQRM